MPADPMGYGAGDSHSRVVSTVNVQGPYIPPSVSTSELTDELVKLLGDLKQGIRPTRNNTTADDVPPPHSGYDAVEVGSDEYDDDY